MRRFARLSLAGAVTVLLATGCGATTHKLGVRRHRGRPPVVVAHPAAKSTPNVRIGRSGAALLSPSHLAFVTTGTVSCAWWPARLTVLGPSSIRIDMRVNGDVTSCGSGGVEFPITVELRPGLVHVSRPLTVRLAYRVRLGRITRHWSRTVVAPAFSRS